MTPARNQRWQMVLTEHRAALGEILRLAKMHPSSGALDGCRSWADRMLRRLNVDARNPRLDAVYSAIGAWGQNGWGPAIRVELDAARFHAERAVGREREVA